MAAVQPSKFDPNHLGFIVAAALMVNLENRLLTQDMNKLHYVIGGRVTDMWLGRKAVLFCLFYLYSRDIKLSLASVAIFIVFDLVFELTVDKTKYAEYLVDQTLANDHNPPLLQRKERLGYPRR